MIQILIESQTNTVPLTNDSSFSTFGLVAAALFFLLLIVGFVAMLARKLRRPDMEGMTPARVKQLWGQIEHSAKQGTLGRKMAVIEADKLLDNVLKSMMLPGETLGERLKMAAYKYPKIRDVWNAHRLRNQLVHETSFELSEREANRALNDFEKCLKMLNVL